MSRPASLVRSKSDGSRFLGPYLLQDCIGRGGTAVLYKARRTGAAGFEKQVVVKTILPELAGDARFVALFEEEAKLQAQLFHANIAQVQDFGVMRGVPFMELEVLSGWNAKQLFDRLAERHAQLPVAIALLMMTDACRGLAYAHAFVDDAGRLRPIIHRDISLANVMICRDGSVKLIDFGLASVTQGETLKIQTFHGKLAYMSPEQLASGRLDRGADVFAMGVVLWELLTGRRLFAGASDEETVRRVRDLAIEPPSRLNSAVPQALDAVVMRALDRDPRHRYASASELLAALDGVRTSPASRSELIAYLGGVAPEIFSTRCDACGGLVPHGSSCVECSTVIEGMEEVVSAPIAVRPPLHVVHTPPEGSPVVQTPARGTALPPLPVPAARRLIDHTIASVCGRVADRVIRVSTACERAAAAAIRRLRPRPRA